MKDARHTQPRAHLSLGILGLHPMATNCAAITPTMSGAPWRAGPRTFSEWKEFAPFWRVVAPDVPVGFEELQPSMYGAAALAAKTLNWLSCFSIHVLMRQHSAHAGAWT